MRMVEKSDVERQNLDIEVVTHAMQDDESNKDGLAITNMGELFADRQCSEQDRSQITRGQVTIFEEPMPIQIEDPLSEKEIEDRASIWVQSNVL